MACYNSSFEILGNTFFFENTFYSISKICVNRNSFGSLKGTINFTNNITSDIDSYLVSSMYSSHALLDGSINISDVSVGKLFGSTYSSNICIGENAIINCSNTTVVQASIISNWSSSMFISPNSVWNGSVTGKKYDVNRYSSVANGSKVLGSIKGTTTNAIVT